jgi:putative redox protein
MEVRIRHVKDKQSEAFGRFHRVICDQPFDQGGGDTGMTPPELMLSGLGCCAMHYATEYLRVRQLPLDNIEIGVSATKGGQPARLTEINIEIHAPNLGTRARDGLVKAIETCQLLRTFTYPPKLAVTVPALALK